MNDYRIVIDAGHGGSDPGSSGNGIIEKDLNLDISNYMYDRFKSLGVPVKIIRNTDETIDPTERVNRVLQAYGNDPKVILISNHINAGGGEGAEVIYALRNTSTLPNLILENLEDAGQVVRKAYQRRLPSDTSKDYYFMQRNTGDVQSLTVEYGFLDTLNDANKLKNNWQEYSDAVVDAVIEYIGLNPDESTYTVKAGDSLWSIGKKLGITVSELKELNNLSSNLLRIGQKLKVPYKGTSDNNTNNDNSTVYTVKSGDSLYSIARRYGVSVDDIVRLNNLPSTNLSINQKLLIPDLSLGENSSKYVVKSGDTLYSIANRFNTTINEIMMLNNLTTSVLNIGQQLEIPGTKGNYIEYTVKKGDSLYSIAQKYNTTVDNIKRKNNLTSNLLNIGQILTI